MNTLDAKMGSAQQRTSSKTRLAIAILPLMALVPVALMGPNTLLALYACVALPIGILLLWRPEEPPILLFLFIYQWIQTTIGTFYSNLLGQQVDRLADHPGRHEEAIALLISGLIVLAAAMRIAAGRARPDLAHRIREMGGNYPPPTWVTIYIVTWLFSFACSTVATFSGGLVQIFLIFAEVKWAAFLLLTASAFGVPQRSKLPWIIAFSVELAMGIGGFFADFSSIFFYSFIGIALAGSDLLKRNKLLIGVGVVMMLTIAVVWTAVKRDYRAFINAGTREQVVVVDYQDRMADLAARIASLDAAAMTDGADKMIKRLSYFEFFGVVLQRNAMGQPHSGGEIWGWGAISTFMPRILFPDKPVADDTALLIRYTGLNQPAWRTGTSISLGYITEAFIDFGRYGMFAAIAALGLLIGMIHRWLLRQKGWRLLIGSGLVPVALMPAHLLEISAVKLLPALALSSLASWIVLNFLAPKLLRSVGVINRRARAARLG
mgnify:FL=1